MHIDHRGPTDENGAIPSGPRSELLLATARIDLEPLHVRHAALLFELLSDSSIYTFVPVEPPANEQELARRMERLERRRSSDGVDTWLNWAIRIRATGEYAGTVQATIRPDHTALLAYELGARFRGHGYATESCRAVIAELFEHYDVRSLAAQVDTRNGSSIRLLERLGFVQTRQVQYADQFKGSWSDEYLYTITRDPAVI